jgi:hypothetical protein
MNALAKGLLWVVLAPLILVGGLMMLVGVLGAFAISAGAVAGLFLTGGAAGAWLLAGVCVVGLALWLSS